MLGRVSIVQTGPRHLKKGGSRHAKRLQVKDRMLPRADPAVAGRYLGALPPARRRLLTGERCGALGLSALLEALCLPPFLTETLVRKGAHMAEYLVLAALLTGSLRNRDRTGRGLCAGVLSASLFCALIDETIQLFVEGRAGKVSDIWVDLGGAALGLLLALAAGVLWRKKRYAA